MIRPEPTAFTRIAVLNRGEAAVRFMRAVREYSLEREVDLAAIALYTDPDEGAPFLSLADEVIHIGAPMRTGPSGLVSAYCDYEHILAHLRAARCDAVWPGWGFVAEDAVFVARLEAEGITFIGPSSHAMWLLGDKIEAKRLAAGCGVPLAPWHIIDPAEAPDVLIEHAERIAFPLMLKASAGGGGRGIRKVDRLEDLLPRVDESRAEVKRVFDHGGLMMEACITGARHIEVQLVVGADGRACALGVRDCTIQRRNQKIIEEAPSPILPADVEELLCTSSARLAEEAGYRGVATAEFLYDPSTGTSCFLEVNSRLQVEHTVTEMTCGVDLVKAQLDIACGLPWEGEGAISRGHAIEVRLNAEDPERGFQPSPGLVRFFRVPAGPGIRVDSGVAEGMNIAPEFDSMIAKVIAWAPTRKQAIGRLRRALQELDIVVEDGATNQAFLADLLRTDAFVDGTADTGWLDRVMAEGRFIQPRWEFEALLAAAILEYRRLRRSDTQRFFAQAQNGIPQNLPEPVGLDIELRLRGRGWVISVHALGDDHYLAGPEGALWRAHFSVTGDHTAEMLLERRHKILFAYGSSGIAVEVDGATHAVERASGGVVKASAPAMVVHVAVQEGQVVTAGERLCTLEAMKMEMAVLAPRGGLVRSVLVRPNQQVAVGQPLIVMEAGNEAEEQARVEAPKPPVHPLDQILALGALTPASIERLGDGAQASIEALVDMLRAAVLGYDVPASVLASIDRLFSKDPDFSDTGDIERWLPLVDLLAAFVDAESLFDRNLILEPEAAAAAPADLAFYEYCRRHHEGQQGAQVELRPLLGQALAWYDIRSLDSSDRLRDALWRLAVAHAHNAHRHRLVSSLMRAVMRLHETGAELSGRGELRQVLDRVAQVASHKFPFVADNARQARYVLFEQSRYVQRRQVVEQTVDRALTTLAGTADEAARQAVIEELVGYPQGILPQLVARVRPDAEAIRSLVVGVIRRIYLDCTCIPRETTDRDGRVIASTFALRGAHADSPDRVLAVVGRSADLLMVLDTVRRQLGGTINTAVELLLSDVEESDGFGMALDTALIEADVGGDCASRMTVSWMDTLGRLRHRNYRSIYGQMVEDPIMRDIHPEASRRIELWRFDEFELGRLESPEAIYAFQARAKANGRDERIFIVAEVHGNGSGRAPASTEDLLWSFEQVYFEALRILRDAQSRRAARRRFHWNRLAFTIRPPVRISAREVAALAQRFEAQTRGLGVEQLVLRVRVPAADGSGNLVDTEFLVHKPGRHRLEVLEHAPATSPLRALTEYEMRVVAARRFGQAYPYELVRMLEGRVAFGAEPHTAMARGRFVEHDLDPETHRLVPVQRPWGENVASVVVGLVSNVTTKHPEGLERVWIASDPTVAMGALAEPECRRVLAAIDLAEHLGLPIEWLPISSGAKISMDSGTENLDWTAAVLRRLVEFTQGGGEVNIIVAGVNVGAQSYWNAEATMLMHTRGVLIMTREGSMVLTGKKALEYSGSVAAEDERGIGGFERIMGPNGQAQYFAAHLGEAYSILFEHYRFTYVGRGEGTPRRFQTTDPVERDVRDSPYASNGDTFASVGEIFDPVLNADRKKPFVVREVMRSVIDQDGGVLERFGFLRHGESAVIWDAHVGGFPVCVIGIESRPMLRRGRIPMDGPEMWTGGTLFPRSSKKVARALNSASGNRPVVVLANLSGFDGSPESLRRLQLEYGAEIGRAVVNFDGPLIFVVIGRYHGGAYVVFSKALNPNLRAIALRGSFASVIGGAPAAAVVFPREVRRRANADPCIIDARRALDLAAPSAQPLLRERLDALYSDVLLEHQGDVAREFDAVHTVERAVAVGSLDAVIETARLRPAIIEELANALGVAIDELPAAVLA